MRFEVTDLLKIVEECGGRIARESYPESEWLLRAGYLEPDGTDAFGRPMIKLSKQGRMVLGPTPRPVEEVVMPSGQISHTRIHPPKATPPSKGKVPQTFTLKRGVYIWGGMGTSVYHAIVEGIVPRSDPWVQLLVRGNRIRVYTVSQVIRCFSWYVQDIVTQPDLWDHTALPLCTTCHGKDADHAGLDGCFGFIAGGGCWDCEYTARAPLPHTPLILIS